MRHLLAITVIGLLSACATPSIKDAPTCDGRSIRPANPYGVTLPGVPEKDAGAQQPDGWEVFTPPPTDGQPTEAPNGTTEVPAIEPQASLSSRAILGRNHRSC